MDFIKLNSAHKVRVSQYANDIEELFAEYEKKIIKDELSKYLDNKSMSLGDFPAIEKRIMSEIRKLLSDVKSTLEKDITKEWDASTKNNDRLFTWAVAQNITSQQNEYYVQLRRDEALDSFLTRKRNGMNLSERVWNLGKNEKEWLEGILQYGVTNGMSAQQMARDLRKFTNEPEYVPTKTLGLKVNHASQFSAMRLARTETNIAYRTSDHNRWQGMDFIIGVKVQLSDRHVNDERSNSKVKDICDELQGIYPKDFLFTGWHPQCRCFATPVMQSEEDFAKGKKAKPITKLPKNFTDWMKANKARIKNASTLPYFIKDNFNEQLQYKTPYVVKPLSPLDIAEKRHLARTDAQKNSIIKAWQERESRNATIKYATKIANKFSNGYADSQFAAISKNVIQALQSKDYQQALNHANELKALYKELKDIKYIENPEKWASEFTIDELKKVSESVEKKKAQLSVYDLEGKKKKIQFEINYIQNPQQFKKGATKYKTWEVAKEAYEGQLKEVNNAILKEQADGIMEELKQFKTKSVKFKEILNSAEEDYNNGSYSEALAKLNEASEKRDEIESKRAEVKAVNFAALDAKVLNDNFNAFSKKNDNLVDVKHREKTEKVWAKLTKAEKMIITKYTETYCYLNEPLRGITYTGSEKGFNKDMPLLTKAIGKSKITKDMVVRRGTDDFIIRELNKSLSDLVTGDEFVDKAFLSTSIRPDRGFRHKSFNLIISVPKGTSAIYAEPFSHYTDSNKYSYAGALWDGKEKCTFGAEWEMIINRGCKFKVNKVKGRNIYLEIIGQFQ